MEELDIRHTSRVVYARLPDGSKAFIRYTIEGGRLKVLETYTPPQYRGRGIARKLMDYTVELAVSKGLQIEPICSYAIYYFIKTPDKKNLLPPEYREADLEKLFKARLEEEKSKPRK